MAQIPPENFSGLSGSMPPVYKWLISANFIGYLLWIICGLLILGSPLAAVFSKGLQLKSLDQMIMRLSLGFMVACWCGLILGSVKLFNRPTLIAFFAILGLVSIVGTSPLPYRSILQKASAQLSGYKKQSETTFASFGLFLSSLLLAFYLVTRMLQGLTPQGHGDPLYYHLSSAWHLIQNQRIAFFPWNPWYLQGGSAELLYGEIGLLFTNLGHAPDRMAMMIVCQLVHGFFSYPAAALLIYKSARLLGITRPLALLGALGAVTIPEGGDALIAAKNDGFVWYFCLTSLYFSLLWMPQASQTHPQTTRLDPCLFRKVMFLAILGAFSFSIKFTAVFYLIPWFLAMFLWGSLQPKNFRLHTDPPETHSKFGFLSKKIWSKGALRALAAVGLLLAVASPHLIRNYLFTENPFFPAFSAFFTNQYVNEVMISMIQSFTKKPGTLLEIIHDQSWRFILAKPIYTCAALGMLLDMARKLLGRKVTLSLQDRRAEFLSYLAVIAMLLIVTVTGRGQFSRFTFFLYGMLSILGVYFLHVFYNYAIKDKNRSIQSIFAIAVTGIVLINGQGELPWLHLIQNYKIFMNNNQTWGQEFAQRKPSYEMHLWINTHNIPGPILSLGDNEDFFLDPPLSIPDNHIGAAAVLIHKDLGKISQEMEKQGFKYLLAPIGWDLPAQNLILRAPDLNLYFTKLYHSPMGYQLFQGTIQKER